MPRSPFLLPVLLACASLTVMAGATIAPGLPGLLAHFSDHPDAEYLTRFIVTVPGLAIAITAPIAGWLADRLGRRVLLQIGVALYIVAGGQLLWSEWRFSRGGAADDPDGRVAQWCADVASSTGIMSRGSMMTAMAFCSHEVNQA